MSNRSRIVKAEVRAVEDSERTLTFTASTEEVARDGDIIRVAGWETENFEKNPVFLWGHDSRLPPIGKVTAVRKVLRGGKRLEIDVEFAGYEQAHDLAESVYLLYRDGFLGAVSVGFAPLEREELDDKKRKRLGLGQFGEVWSRAELFEVSAVTVPSDPGALKKEGVEEAALAVRSALGVDAAGWPTIERAEGETDTTSDSITALAQAVTALQERVQTLGADLFQRIDAIASEFRGDVLASSQGSQPQTEPSGEDDLWGIGEAISERLKKDTHDVR